MIQSITLLGSSSGRNAGDAALMAGIMDSVDTACKTRLLYEIPTIKPRFVAENYRNRVLPISMMPWNLSIKMLGLPTYNSIMRTDLSLVFDAILFDRALYNPLFNFLSTLYLMLPRAKTAGKKIGFYNIGAGPVTTPEGQRMLREIAEIADFITVRDQDSYDLLRSIGVKSPRMILTADAALNVVGANEERIQTVMDKLGLDAGEEILAININQYLDSWSGTSAKSMGKEAFLKAYAGALNRVLKDLKRPLLFVSTQHHDVSITRELIGMLSGPRKVAWLSNTEYNHDDIKGVLSKVQLLFAMRLHAMILCSSAHTPIIGLAYQPKCHYYFRTLGIPEYSMGFETFSEEALYQQIMRGWENRQEIRSKLDVRIPVLQNEANKAAELVAGIHRGEDIEQALIRLGSN